MKSTARVYDEVSKIDKQGNIWTGTRARTPHFDWLKDAVINGHYELCGTDNILTAIEGNTFTFTECEDLKEKTFVTFIGNEAWLRYESVVFFEG